MSVGGRAIEKKRAGWAVREKVRSHRIHKASGHQRIDRRAHRGYMRRAVHGRSSRRAAIRAARIANGRRFFGSAEAAARKARTRSDQKDSENAAGGSVFFFQAEDGIRDVAVTGVQACALPISIEHLGELPGGERDVVVEVRE